MTKSKLLISSVVGVAVIIGAIVAFSVPTGRAQDSDGVSSPISGVSTAGGAIQTPQVVQSTTQAPATSQKGSLAGVTAQSSDPTATPDPSASPEPTPSPSCVPYPTTVKGVAVTGQECSANTTSFNYGDGR